MPIPKPKEQEKQKDYITRCLGAIAEEYEDATVAAGICHDAWKEDKSTQNARKTFDLEVEILATGKWNGLNFERDDLELMAVAFEALKDNHQVPLKMGHNKKQPFTDGQPALGWVSAVFVKADKLVAKFTDVPKVVYEAMKQKLYKNVSAEVDLAVEYKGNYYPRVLSGVALLGADIPAVNTLSDLQAYMGKGFSSQKRMVFTAISTKQNSKRSLTMSVEAELREEIKTLNEINNAQKIELTKLTEGAVLLERKIADGGAKFRILEAAEITRKLGETRELMLSKLEGMVKDSKLTPAARDQYMKDFDDAAEDDKDRVVFAVKRLAETIEGNPKYFGAEQARVQADKDRQEQDKDPGHIVLARTNEYMVKNGEKDFVAAKTAILRADPELAERYAKDLGGVQ